MKSISYPVTLCCPSTLGLLGVCAYLVGFTLPFRWDIPLIVLVLATVLATGFTDLEKAPVNRRLFFSMLAYLAATGFSMLLSEDLARSTRLSISFLPGLLLFFLITHHITGDPVVAFLDDQVARCVMFRTKRLFTVIKQIPCQNRGPGVFRTKS